MIPWKISSAAQKCNIVALREIPQNHGKISKIVHELSKMFHERFFYAVNDLLKRWKDVWNNFATRYNMYNLTSQTNENSFFPPKVYVILEDLVCRC
jgi:hypothetical protein